MPEEVRRSLGTIQGALSDIGDGIGRAARSIADVSQTEVGGLAVKGAEVTVEFEVVAEGSRESVGIDGKPSEFGVTAFRSPRISVERVTEQRSNKAIIKFQAVAVPPREKPAGLPGGWPWDRWKREDVEALVDALGQLVARARDKLPALEAFDDYVARSRAGVVSGRLPGATQIDYEVVRDRCAARLALLAKLADAAPPEAKATNADGVELVTMLQAIAEVLGEKRPIEVLTAREVLASMQAVLGYFKGILAAG